MCPTGAGGDFGFRLGPGRALTVRGLGGWAAALSKRALAGWLSFPARPVHPAWPPLTASLHKSEATALVCWTSGSSSAAPQPCPELLATHLPSAARGGLSLPLVTTGLPGPTEPSPPNAEPCTTCGWLQLHCTSVPHGACSRSTSTRVPTSKMQFLLVDRFPLKENVCQPQHVVL